MALVLLTVGSVSAADLSASERDLLSVPPPADDALVAKASSTDASVDAYGLVVSSRLRGLVDAVGKWTIVDAHRERWTWSVASKGAAGLELHLSDLQLPPSAVIRLFEEAGYGSVQSEAVWTIGADEILRDHFRTPFVQGEQMRIEIEVDSYDREALAVSLEGITYGYKSPFAMAKSASCNIDAACSQANDKQDQMASVAQYTFLNAQGLARWCTGSLIANTNATSTPNFITANHCVSTENVANTTTFYWNYESRTCRASGSASNGNSLAKATYASHSQYGSALKMTYSQSDTTLLRLDLEPPAAAMVYYAGWNRSTTAPSSTYTFHHADGDEKRFSYDNNAPTLSTYEGPAGSGTAYWRIGFYEGGITETGSSGAPLFNQAGQIVGVLAGGLSICMARGPDWYSRLSQAWNGGGTSASRLKDWLDPGATSVVSYGGYYPANIALRQRTTNYAISDFSQTDSTINVSGAAGNGSSASRVKVRLSHSYLADLIIELIAPDGSKYLLHNKTEGSSDNLHKTYAVNLSSEPKNGVWTLRVSDTASGDTGLLDYWAIKL